LGSNQELWLPRPARNAFAAVRRPAILSTTIRFSANLDKNRTMATDIYDADFLRWTQEQSALLRAGKWAELDQEHIAEELEEMGKEQKLALQSLLRQILVNLIKLEYSPAKAPRDKWIEEIIEFRDQAQARIDATPSLKHHAPELFEKAWQLARRAAVKTFELHHERVSVPERCPYLIAQVLDPDYFPGLGAELRE